MKAVTSFIAAFCLTIATTVAAQPAERFSKTYPLGRGGQFSLANIAGDIVVTAGAGEDVKIDAVKQGPDARDVTIEVTPGAGRLEVRTVYPRRGNVNASVNYTVSVPRGTCASLRSVSGNIRVAGVEGELVAESVSGNVETSSARPTTLKSVSGNVTAQSVSGDAITMTTVSGNVKATGLKARSLETTTVSGDFTLADVACERLTAKSVSGDIDYAGPLAKGGRYEVKTHSGSVHIAPRGPVGFELDASTFSGNIKSDLPLVMQSGEAGQSRRFRHETRGTYGDAGAFIAVTTFSGDVSITK